MTELIEINKEIFTYAVNKIDSKLETLTKMLKKENQIDVSIISIDEASIKENDYDKLEKIV